MAIKMERVVKKFYTSLDEGKILGKRCKKCGAVQFPPRIVCNECGSMDQEWIEMSGKATLTDLTRPSQMTGDCTDIFKPFNMGCVRMEEGPELNGIIKDVTPEQKEELQKKLPLELNAEIFPTDHYKTVVFKLAQ